MPFSYDRVRQELLEEQAKLHEQLERLAATEYESVGYSNHMADDATEAFEQAKDLALRQGADRMLAEVNHALEKFCEGTYGWCEKCGQEIDWARLEALPAARLCITCQQHREVS